MRSHTTVASTPQATSRCRGSRGPGKMRQNEGKRRESDELDCQGRTKGEPKFKGHNQWDLELHHAENRENLSHNEKRRGEGEMRNDTCKHFAANSEQKKPRFSSEMFCLLVSRAKCGYFLNSFSAILDSQLFSSHPSKKVHTAGTISLEKSDEEWLSWSRFTG